MTVIRRVIRHNNQLHTLVYGLKTTVTMKIISSTDTSKGIMNAVHPYILASDTTTHIKAMAGVNVANEAIEANAEVACNRINGSTAVSPHEEYSIKDEEEVTAHLHTDREAANKAIKVIVAEKETIPTKEVSFHVTKALYNVMNLLERGNYGREAGGGPP